MNGPFFSDGIMFWAAADPLHRFDLRLFGPLVHVVDPDDPDLDRYGRVKDVDEYGTFLVHFYTGDGEPRGWFMRDQLEAVNAIPPTPA
jgi:hypothetical protein